MDKISVIKALLKDDTTTDESARGESAYKIGENYQFRTVTHIITGKLLRICYDGLVVVDAAWIADTGRFADAVRDGTYSEVEPYPDGVEVIVNWEAMIDAVQIKELPREQV